MGSRKKGAAWPAGAALALAALMAGCDEKPLTGYLLDIRTPPPEDQIPTTISVQCLKPGGFCLKNFSYPDSGQKLSYKENNRLATIAINVQSDLDKPRRLWVRGRVGTETVAESATFLEDAVEGKQHEIVVLMSWGRLPDLDGDLVPDKIDDCPRTPDPDQDGACNEVDAATPDPIEKLDAATPSDAGVDTRVVDAAKG